MIMIYHNILHTMVCKCIYIYTYVSTRVCVYIYVYIYVYMHRGFLAHYRLSGCKILAQNSLVRSICRCLGVIC